MVQTITGVQRVTTPQPERRCTWLNAITRMAGRLRAQWRPLTESIRVRTECVELAKITQPLKLTHITDLHFGLPKGDSMQQITEVITLALKTQPDRFILTGDYIYGQCQNRPELVHQLNRLSKQTRTYACLGNHDGGRGGDADRYADETFMLKLLDDAKIQVLFNKSTADEEYATDWVGLADYSSANYAGPKVLSGLPESKRTRIVLSHNPNTAIRLVSEPH